MRKATLVLLSTLLLVPATFAQTKPRFAFYAGLGHALQNPNTGVFAFTAGDESGQFDPCTAEGAEILGANLQRVFCDRRDFHGLDLGARYHLTRYLAVRGDFSFYRNKDKSIEEYSSCR